MSLPLMGYNNFFGHQCVLNRACWAIISSSSGLLSPSDVGEDGGRINPHPFFKRPTLQVKLCKLFLDEGDEFPRGLSFGRSVFQYIRSYGTALVLRIVKISWGWTFNCPFAVSPLSRG